ncbi:MAG: diguanylate cyclase [Candidatus Sulfobium sp.]
MSSWEHKGNRYSQYKFHGTDRPVTVSVGISGMPDPGIDSEDKMIRCADFALYEAKRNGRNRVEAAEGKDVEAALSPGTP